MLKKIMNYIYSPQKLILFILTFKIFRILPDRIFLRLKYRIYTGYSLNLNNPKTYNEKLQWLKLYDRDPQYTQLVDKFGVRSFITDKIGEEYLVPLLGVYDNFEDINFENLPNQFVLKCNHDSGGLVICKDKNQFNMKKAKDKIEAALSNNYFYSNREWPYKNVEPKILCEKLIVQENNQELKDYRFFCFHGVPKFISVDLNITEKSDTRRNLYNLKWDLMDEEISYPKDQNTIINIPGRLDEMIKISEFLSKSIPHCRIDFYFINNNIIVNEITFFHQSGMGTFTPPEFGIEVGSWLILPK